MEQIGRWENGKSNPKLNTIQKIAAALNVNVNDLLGSPLDDSPLYKTLKNANPADYPIGRDFINAQLSKQVDDWQQIDIELVKTFKKLNEAGKAIAVERIEELTEIPRYTKNEKKLLARKNNRCRNFLHSASRYAILDIEKGKAIEAVLPSFFCETFTSTLCVVKASRHYWE